MSSDETTFDGKDFDYKSKKSNKGIIVALIAIVVIAGGIYVLTTFDVEVIEKIIGEPKVMINEPVEVVVEFTEINFEEEEIFTNSTGTFMKCSDGSSVELGSYVFPIDTYFVIGNDCM